MSIADEKAKFKLTDIDGQGLGLTIPSTIQKANVKFVLKRDDEFESCRKAKEREIKFKAKNNGAFAIHTPKGIDYSKTNKITIKGANTNDNPDDYGIALKNYGSSDAGFDSTINGENESEEDTFTLSGSVNEAKNYVLDELLGRTDGGNNIDYHDYLKNGDTKHWDGRKVPEIKNAGQEIRFYDADGSDVNAKLTFKNKDIYIPKYHSVEKITIQKKGSGEITKTANDDSDNVFYLTVNSNSKTFYPISYSGNYKTHNLDKTAKTWGQIYWESSCPRDSKKDGQLYIQSIEDVELIDPNTPEPPPPDVPDTPDPPPSPPPAVPQPPTGPTECPPGPWSPDYDEDEPCPTRPGVDNGGDKELILRTSGTNGATLDLKHYADKIVTLRVEWSKDSDWSQSFSFTVPACSDVTGTSTQTPLFSPVTLSKTSGSGSWNLYNVDGGSKISFTSNSTDGTQPSRQVYKLVVNCTTSGDPPVKTCVRTCEPDYIEYAEPWIPCDKGTYVTKTGYNQVAYGYADGSKEGGEAQYVTITVLATRDILKPNKDVSFDKGLQRHIWMEDITPLDDNGEPGHSLSDYHTLTSDELKRIRNPVNGTSKTDLPDGGTGCEELFNHAGAMLPARIDQFIADGITDLSSI